MKHAFLLTLALCNGAALLSQATIRQVPGQYNTIQAAINASAHGDTIVVAPGVYFENISFRGKRVVLTSQFLFSQNYTHIRNTVINGSQPVHADTASVVRFTNAEDTTTALIGFTLTGGKGTKWPDAHIGGKYREGGAILLENASPVIRYNLIIDNEAINKAGAASAGGGGLRSDGGQPRILNNVFIHNRGLYGGGIVLNYSGAIIRNNIIAQNTGGQEFGGSGIWMLENAPFPKIIENNTIIGNRSLQQGGGIRIEATTATLRNNLIWGNSAPTGPQIAVRAGATLTASYNNVQGGFPGTGNMALSPLLADSGCFLLSASPCTDAGDPAPAFHDPVLPGSPTLAVYPSTGSATNDIGAYGGQGRSLFPSFSAPGLVTGPTVAFGNKPMGLHTRKLAIMAGGTAPLQIDSVRLRTGTKFSVSSLTVLFHPLEEDSVMVTWQPLSTGPAVDTILIYHADPSQANPKKVIVRGNAIVGTKEAHQDHTVWMRLAGPDPAAAATAVEYFLPAGAEVQLGLCNVLGQEVSRLSSQPAAAGLHQCTVPAASLAPGMYLLRLTVRQLETTVVRTLPLLVQH